MHLSRAAAIVGILIFGAVHTAAAQQTSVDVARLPIDLAKIQRQLRVTESTDSRTALHIRYTVDVYGQAPRMQLFTKEDNLVSGPVPYGAPTHHEMIYQVTPIEFQSPVMDVSALLRWLTDKANKK
jgi:hypothetical protein